MPGIRNTIVLLSNAAATGNPFKVDVGGTYFWMVQGTFAGATVDLRILGPDGVNYILVTGSALTANGMVSVDLPSGAMVKAQVTAGPPSGIYASLALIG